MDTGLLGGAAGNLTDLANTIHLEAGYLAQGFEICGDLLAAGPGRRLERAVVADGEVGAAAGGLAAA